MIIELCIVGLCVLILITILIILIYFGYFRFVEISTGTPPINFSNKMFAYKSFNENFSGIGFQFTRLHNLTAVEDKNLRKKFNEAIVIAIYYDNPGQIKDTCKFSIGLILEGESYNVQIKEILKKEEFKFSTLPETDHVVYTSFPFKGTISVPIAIRSVYPKLTAFVKKKKLCAYPLIELYTQNEIHFILPLNKQQDYIFYSDDNNDSSATEDKDVNNSDNLSDENRLSLSDNECQYKKFIKKKLIKKRKENKKTGVTHDNNSSGSSFDELNIDESVNQH